MDFSNFQFESLQDIPPVQCYYDTPRVSVTEKGLFSINGAMRRRVGEQRSFRVKMSPDGYYLGFYLDQEPNVRFAPKSGNTTHDALKELLRDNGIQLPAVYTMEWCAEQRGWFGHCQELPQLPDLTALQKSRRGRGNDRRRKRA